MSYDHIRNNIREAIHWKGQHGAWLLQIAQVQAHLAQVELLERIAFALEREQRVREREAAEAKVSGVDALPLFAALRAHAAPDHIIADIRREIVFGIRYRPNYPLERLSIEEIEAGLRTGPDLGANVSELLQRRLRFYLLGLRDPRDLAAVADVTELPIYDYLMQLPLTARTRNALRRDLTDGRDLTLRTLTVEAFLALLARPYGGMLGNIRNVGAKTIEELRRAVRAPKEPHGEII